MGKNYYEILNIPKNSSTDEIKKAFRSLAKIHHPDKPTGNEDKFKELNKSYEVLSDPEKRNLFIFPGYYIEIFLKGERTPYITMSIECNHSINIPNWREVLVDTNTNCLNMYGWTIFQFFALRNEEARGPIPKNKKEIQEELERIKRVTKYKEDFFKVMYFVQKYNPIDFLKN